MMRLLLQWTAALLLAFPFPAQGPMFPGPGMPSAAASSYTIVQTASCVTSGLATACSTASTSWTGGAGHVFIAYGAFCYGSSCNLTNGITGISVSEATNGAWNCPVGAFVVQGGTGGYAGQACYFCNPISGTYTVTLGASGGSSGSYAFPALEVAEVSGLASVCNDSAVTASGSGTASTTESITSGTVGQASEFIFMGIQSYNASLTPGQTLITANHLEYTVGPASGTQTMTWTSASGQWVGAVIGLKHP